MTTKQLQEKYGLSRSSIQRVKPAQGESDLEARASEFFTESKPEPPPQETKTDKFAEKFVLNMLKDEMQAISIPEIPAVKETSLITPTRDELIQKILLNADTFPAHYPFITDRTAFMNSLSEKSTGALQDLLNTMEKTRSVNNFAAQMKQVFFVGSRALVLCSACLMIQTGFAG